MPPHLTGEHVIRLVDDAAAQTAAINEELSHMNRLATLGTIAASVAHEINNLLTPVVAYAQLARSHPDDQELLRKALDRAGGGAEAVTVIAQAMLDFARPDAGPPLANVADALERTLACLARRPEKDGIRLETDIPPDLFVSIQVVVLQQVMMNLIMNATDAMRSSGQGDRLSIRARSVQPGRPGGRIQAGVSTAGVSMEPAGAAGATGGPATGEMIEIIVADNGPGMAGEVAARVFQPFASASRSLARAAGATIAPDEDQNPPNAAAEAQDLRDAAARRGTGLGLSICQRLIEQAGGSITLQSEPGSGAVFHVCLPRASSAGEHSAHENIVAHDDQDDLETPKRAAG